MWRLWKAQAGASWQQTCLHGDNLRKLIWSIIWPQEGFFKLCQMLVRIDWFWVCDLKRIFLLSLPNISWIELKGLISEILFTNGLKQATYLILNSDLQLTWRNFSAFLCMETNFHFPNVLQCIFVINNSYTTKSQLSSRTHCARTYINT